MTTLNSLDGIDKIILQGDAVDIGRNMEGGIANETALCWRWLRTSSRAHLLWCRSSVTFSQQRLATTDFEVRLFSLPIALTFFVSSNGQHTTLQWVSSHCQYETVRTDVLC